MKCVDPYISGKAALPCGKCMPCRFNRRRMWTHRLMLEALDHDDKSFITLTYAPEKCPVDGSLRPTDLQQFIKRLRWHCSSRKLRYYAVGEYGDKSQRPHYHLAMFGFRSCDGRRRKKDGLCECPSCKIVAKCWEHGFFSVYPLEEGSIQYTCGYVVKKMTAKDDFRLNGRYPEFARMSLKPGIGANAMCEMASAMIRADIDGELPYSWRMNGKLRPFGRYLRNHLSKQLGQSDEQRAALSDQALSRLYEELSQVRAFAWLTEKSVREVFRAKNEPVARKLEARYRGQGRSL